MTPSNRIGPIVLSLPHPRFWARAESLFLPRSGPAEPTRLSTHHPGRTRSPTSGPIHQWDTPRYHLGGLTFFQYRHFFYMHPQLGLTAMRIPALTQIASVLQSNRTMLLAWRCDLQVMCDQEAAGGSSMYPKGDPRVPGRS